MDGLETNISVFFNLTDMDSACEFSYTNILEYVYTFVSLASEEDFEFIPPVMVVFNHDNLDGDTLCTEIGIVDDDIYEGNEQFLVTITSVFPSSAAIIGTTSSLLKYIEDNGGWSFL